MNNNIATIILNRNLPQTTDKLVEHLLEYDSNQEDIYVLEAGSDSTNLSRYCTWHESSNEVKEFGLRYSRGMNYALLKLWEEGKWDNYDAFFLLTNDTELNKTHT